MLDAIKETRSVDGNTLADALEAKPHKTVVGKVSYTKDDHYTTRTWPIYSYSSGKPRLVTEGQAALHSRIRRLGDRAPYESALHELAERLLGRPG